MTRTTGYDFVRREAVSPAAMEYVSDFYAKVLPVAEEREVFLRAAGAALSGNSHGDKFFLVATDMRQGGNGKSTLLQALQDAFGAFAVPSQANFLFLSRSASPCIALCRSATPCIALRRSSMPCVVLSRSASS